MADGALDAPSNIIPSFDIQSGKFSNITMSNGNYNKAKAWSPMYASSILPEVPLSFAASPWQGLGGMVTFNSTNPKKPTWSFSNSSTPWLEGCATEFVRYGSQGILVAVGGTTGDTPTGGATPYRDMSSIQIYDIAAQNWFEITATGDIPPGRESLCSGLAAASDDSSFQMVVYGGQISPPTPDPTVDPQYPADVYVLIMPAFHWIKTNASFALNTVANGTSFNASSGRSSSYCSTYKDRSFIVVGGDRNTHDSDLSPPLKLLDLNTYQWQTNYPLADTTYRLPQAVIDVVGGGPSGGANPAYTWNYTLGTSVKIFDTVLSKPGSGKAPSAPGSGNGAQTPKAAPNPNNRVSSSAQSQDATPPQSTSAVASDCGTDCPGAPPVRHPIATLVGVIVGSVAGCMLLLAVGFYVMILHRRWRELQAQSQDADASWKPELSGTPSTSPHPQTRRPQRQPRHRFWTPSLTIATSTRGSRRTSRTETTGTSGGKSFGRYARRLKGGEMGAGEVAVEAPSNDYHAFHAELASPTDNNDGQREEGQGTHIAMYSLATGEVRATPV